MEPVADIQPPEPAVPRDPRELPMNQREAGAIERIVALAFAAWIFSFTLEILRAAQDDSSGLSS